MSASRIHVAVQGEPGSNSALAAAQRFGSDRLHLVPCRTFADLFAAVASRQAEFGLAPVENSLGGSVHLVWEQLAQGRCRVLDELYFHVRHCLIAHPAVPLQEVRRIYSHEQALAQCQRFLRKLVWIDPEDIVPVYDTAGAVKMVRARDRREEAAIAAPQAADIYGMRILAQDIQTDPNNFTRFLVLGALPACTLDTPGPSAAADVPPPRLKATLILVVDELARCVPLLARALDEAHLPVVKLETCKLVGSPWQYRVYLDVDATVLGPHGEIEQAVPQMRTAARWCRVVGTYPLAPLPAPVPAPQSSTS